MKIDVSLDELEILQKGLILYREHLKFALDLLNEDVDLTDKVLQVNQLARCLSSEKVAYKIRRTNNESRNSSSQRQTDGLERS